MNSELLSLLTREGVLLAVSVRYWRGCKKLRAEDLGLNSEDVSARLISLGHKRLLPREATAALALIEGRTHAFVEANTFPFLGGLAHFLPNGRLDDVTTRLHELETGFWAAKADFLQRYAELRESAAAEWRALAGKLVAHPEQFVATIESSFPLPQQMDRFFAFETHQFQVSAPEELQRELITTAERQSLIHARQRAANEASAKIRRDVEGFVADCVASLREQTATLCQEMLTSIQTSETGVHQKTLNRLVRFIDQFQQMNFANDTEMARQLATVRTELLTRTAEEYRDSATALHREDYLLAPESGIFEICPDLGAKVKRGQTVGCIHHLERPDRAPEPLVAQSSGFLITIRAPCLTQQGDCVAVIAQQVSEREVMKA